MNEFSSPPFPEPPPLKETPPERQWYRVEVMSAHSGAGSHERHYNYVYVEDAGEALEKFRRMRGVRKDYTPNIPPTPMNPEEVAVLEEIIKELFDLEMAKEKVFYGIWGNFGSRKKPPIVIEELLQQRLKERQQKF